MKRPREKYFEGIVKVTLRCNHNHDNLIEALDCAKQLLCVQDANSIGHATVELVNGIYGREFDSEECKEMIDNGMETVEDAIKWYKMILVEKRYI